MRRFSSQKSLFHNQLTRSNHLRDEKNSLIELATSPNAKFVVFDEISRAPLIEK
jgi:hypothetical protein